MKNQLLSDSMLCFLRFFLLFFLSLTRKTWRIFQNFFFFSSSYVHARSVGRQWRKQFLSRRSHINLSGLVSECVWEIPCVYVPRRSHSSHFWPWREHYLSHIFLLSRWVTRSSRMFIYLLFLLSFDYGIIRSDFDINFMTSSSAESRIVTLSFIKKFMIPITMQWWTCLLLLPLFRLINCSSCCCAMTCRLEFVSLLRRTEYETRKRNAKKKILTVMGQRSERAKKA